MMILDHPIFQRGVFTHPVYGTFVRLTAIIAVALLALVLLAFVMKIVLFAAIVAAFAALGIGVYRRFIMPRLGSVKPFQQ